jgi:hypothetical protein
MERGSGFILLKLPLILQRNAVQMNWWGMDLLDRKLNEVCEKELGCV